MSLQQDRRRIYVQGLDTAAVRLIDPAGGGDAIVDTDKFYDLGFHESTTLVDVIETEEVYDEQGHLLDIPARSRKVSGIITLLQTSKDEFDLVRNAVGKIFAMRLHGLTSPVAWQYFCFPQVRLNPSFNLEFKVGKRTLPIPFTALYQGGTFNIPYYYTQQRTAEMYVPFLGLWVEPNEALNVGTAKLLDMSGWERHGDISAGYATIWQLASGLRFLRLDGTDDIIDFGDVLSIDNSIDVLIEAWVRVMGADASLQEIVSKKASAGNADGYSIVRLASNKLRFELADGSASVTVDSATSLLTNTWAHVAVTVNRDGNATMYLNGAADGTPASVAALGLSSSTDHLILGKLSTGYGQVDIGNFRITNFGASGLPSYAATIVANHFAAERATYGI